MHVVSNENEADLIIHSGSTVPTVEVVLQFKLSASTCGTDMAVASYRLQTNARVLHRQP